jgi:hypothetical protein
MLEHTAKNPILLPCILLSSLLFTLFLPGSIREGSVPLVQNIPNTPIRPAPQPEKLGSRLKHFIQSVINGNASQVVGILAPGEFTHPIIQQPKGNAVYVSDDPDQLTQYGLPSQYGTIALLAHNTLAGGDFYKLRLGSSFDLVFGNGSTKRFQVSSIQEYQALDPENPYSSFVIAGSPAPKLSSGDLFRRVYTHPGDVVFQTCIARDGQPSWGRIFITAHPVTNQPEYTTPSFQLASVYPS